MESAPVLTLVLIKNCIKRSIAVMGWVNVKAKHSHPQYAVLTICLVVHAKLAHHSAAWTPNHAQAPLHHHHH